MAKNERTATQRQRVFRYDRNNSKKKAEEKQNIRGLLEIKWVLPGGKGGCGEGEARGSLHNSVETPGRRWGLSPWMGGCWIPGNALQEMGLVIGARPP